MLKKIVLGLLLTSSLFGENELWKFFKYSTAYGSFSLNAPRFQDDRFAVVGGLSTGCLLYTSPSPRDQRGSRMPSSA